MGSADDLRTTGVTPVLAQGVAPRVVMEVLGHSQISLTMGTYAHRGPALGQSAAVKLDDLVFRDSVPTAS